MQRIECGDHLLLQDDEGYSRELSVVTREGRKVTLHDNIINKDVVYSLGDLEKALVDGTLEFVSCQPKDDGTGPLDADFGSYPECLQEGAIRRYHYIKALEEAEIRSYSDEALESILPEIALKRSDPKPPCARSVRRWRRKYIRNDQDIRCFISMDAKKGRRNSRLHPDIDRKLAQIMADLKKGKRLSYGNVFERLELWIYEEQKRRPFDDNFKMPSANTIRRRFKKYNRILYEYSLRGRKKASEANRGVERINNLSRILQRVEADHTRLDLFVLDDEHLMPLGRPWITAILDIYSHSILGFYVGFIPPSYVSVAWALKHAISPKSYLQNYSTVQHEWPCCGRPEWLVVDNGPEFWGAALEAACLDLHIDYLFCPGGKAWYKGAIERYFKRVNQDLLAKLPGNTFNDIFDVKDFDPEKNAVITFSRFMEIIHIWVVDIYQQGKMLDDTVIPDVLWRESQEEYPPLLVETKRLKISLGATHESILTREGITLDYLKYNPKELKSLRARVGDLKVRYKVDEGELSTIYVLDPETQKYLTIQHSDQDYTRGLTLWQHKINRRYAKNYINSHYRYEDIVEAKRRIQALIQQELEERKLKTSTRTKIARYQNVGQDLEFCDSPAGLDDRLDDILPSDVDNLSQSEIPDTTGWHDDD